MSTTIFHEPTAVKTAAGRMGTIINSMNNIESAIGKIHCDMSDSWQGKAANQNAINFQALQKMTQDYIKDASDTKEALDSAVAAYEQTELSQRQNVSNLSTQGIF